MKPPRPWLRASIVFVAGCGTVSAQRFDALSKPGGSSVIWAPLVVSVLGALVAGAAPAAATYWATAKELREYRRANATEHQYVELLSVLHLMAVAQRAIASSTLAALDRGIGVFLQQTVTAVVQVIKELHAGEDVKVRVAFIAVERNGSAPQGTDTSAGGFVLGPLHGVYTDFVWDAQEHLDFTREARVLLDEQEPGFRFGRPARGETSVDRLRFAGGQPDAMLRLPVVAGILQFGLLVIDVWGDTVWVDDTQFRRDKGVLQALAYLLATGLAAGDLRKGVRRG